MLVRDAGHLLPERAIVCDVARALSVEVTSVAQVCSCCFVGVFRGLTVAHLILPRMPIVVLRCFAPGILTSSIFGAAG